MFWVNALTEVKVINVISTVFYIHRGLSLRAIFLTAIVFALANLLAEVPSSYLADKWGRKKMIIVSIVLSLVYWIINLFAHTEAQFLIGFAFFGLAFAFMSGTGEALIYDTKVALK
jgi:MFS family permease